MAATSVRTASARLAATRRWHPDDADAIRRAQRALDVAQAAELAAQAARLLTRDGS